MCVCLCLCWVLKQDSLTFKGLPVCVCSVGTFECFGVFLCVRLLVYLRVSVFVFVFLLVCVCACIVFL